MLFRSRLQKAVDDNIRILSQEEYLAQNPGEEGGSSAESAALKRNQKDQALKGDKHFDFSALKKSLEEKRAENEKLKDMLKKQGIDTSGIRFGNGADFLDSLMDDIKGDGKTAKKKKEENKKKKKNGDL